MNKRVKNINKTKTIICANLHDSHHYSDRYTASKFIDACLQLAEEYPDTFKIVESSIVHIVIKTTDIKHCFDLYKHNEGKVTK